MAIQLEYINVIIPLEVIREKLGEGYIEENSLMAYVTNWSDGVLFREGCMNEMDLGDILDKWEAAGLELLTVVEGEKQWKDVCVVYSGHGPSYPCGWIEYDKEKNTVWLKGIEPGETAGPGSK